MLVQVCTMQDRGRRTLRGSPTHLQPMKWRRLTLEDRVVYENHSIMYNFKALDKS